MMAKVVSCCLYESQNNLKDNIVNCAATSLNLLLPYKEPNG